MKNWIGLVPAVHLLLIKDNKVLMLRRFKTGYYDGFYSLVAGHVEAGESAKQGMAREAYEESGLKIDPHDLKLAHIIHRNENQNRIDFFFNINKWQGEPKVMEPDKCDELKWFPLDDLPENIIPYIKFALNNYHEKIFYSEFGWA